MTSTPILERADSASSLTRREWEVAQLLSRGHSTKEIAAALGVSLHTVRRHSEQIFRKFNVQCRTAAAVRFLGLATERP